MRLFTCSFLLANLIACGDDGTAERQDVPTASDGSPDASSEADADVTSDVAPETSADLGPDATTATDTAPSDADTVADTTDTADASPSDTTTPDGRLRVIAVDTPIDLSADGDIALLMSLGSPEGDVYFYSVLAGRLDLKTKVGDPRENFATGFSDGGRVSALHGSPVQAGIWSEETGWIDLASPDATGCDNNRGGAWDVSGDGKVAVGFFWIGCTTEAFRWSDATGAGVITPLQILGATTGLLRGPVNRATVVSDDGLVAAGFAENLSADRSPAIWRADGTGFLLNPLELDAPGEILSINTDGSVVAGTWGNAGFFWSEERGVVYTGVPPEGLPSDRTYVNAIVGDAALLFGSSGDPFFGLPMAFVWTETHGARLLQNIVLANGIAIPEGSILTNVLATSRDGSVVLGTILDEGGIQKSFLLEMPVSAYE